MDRATTRNQKVFLEVLWHRKAQEERKAKDELCSEAIELQNWRNPRPAEAASPTKISESKVDYIGFLEEKLTVEQWSITKRYYKTN